MELTEQLHIKNQTKYSEGTYLEQKSKKILNRTSLFI